jgi:type IV pilus assembly protein PilQ
MRKWIKTAGILFLAASAVYSDPVSRADEATAATPPGGAAASRDAFARFQAAAAKPAATEAAHPATAAAAAEADPVVVEATPAEAAGSAAPVTSTSGGAQQVSVNDAGTVEIHVNDANVNEVLRMLSLQLERNILPSKEVRGTVTANLYDVTVKEALDAILRANGFDYREKGNVIYVYSAKEIEDQEKKNRTTRTQIFRLYYTPAANAANMIKPVLSADAQVSFTTPSKSGIGSDSTDAGGDSHATEDVLVVTDFPEKLENVARIIKEIDRRPQQILVEAVIMRATLQDDNALGVDFTAVGGVDFSSLSDVAGGTSTASGLGQALNGQIVENPKANAVNDAGLVAGSVGGGGLKLGLVKNNMGLFIQALEGVTDTVVMANPKVLVLNKQKGEVHVGSEQGYRTTVTSEVLAAEDVKFLETGTRLVFRPYIGDNGNIRMEIKPEDSSGSVNAAGLPNKFVTQVTTNVMVKDGHTIVIGGLFRESNSSTRSQVPGLGSLPGVGPLFGRRTDNTVREEVIILLTPHIVKDEAAYAAAGEEELKNADRLRVGMRKGMMPWGRERLAEASYEKAVQELNKPTPDTKKAIWYLDCATNLNPKFSEAIALKSRTTGKEVASVDNSSIRHFVTRQILHERLNPPAGNPATAPAPSLLLPMDEPRVAAPAATPAPAVATVTPPTTPAVAVAPAAAKATPATRPAEPAVAAAPVKSAAAPADDKGDAGTTGKADTTVEVAADAPVVLEPASEVELADGEKVPAEADPAATEVTALPAD